tara:strand:+ start:2810 stop:2998 length:189 start_codon:yes stop_codon:yes gene_type:complete
MQMQIIDSRLAKVVSWYDKEWGCSIGVEKSIQYLAQLDRIASLLKFLNMSSQNLREHEIEFH